MYSFVDQFWKADSSADGIYYALQYYAKKYPKLPLFIIENSIPTEDHKPRSDGYLREDHLRDIVFWLEKAKADGMNVAGYNYWSLTDNYEWGSYTPRFGLYTVDVKTDPTLDAGSDAGRRGVSRHHRRERRPGRLHAESAADVLFAGRRGQ